MERWNSTAASVRCFMTKATISSSLFSEMALRYNTRSLNKSRLPDDFADVLAFELLMGFNSSIKHSIRDSLFFQVCEVRYVQI